VKMETHIEVNHAENYAVFSQVFPDGAENMATGDVDSIISAFPVFVPHWKAPKGVVAYQGDQAGGGRAHHGNGTRVGPWSATVGGWHSEKESVISSGIKGTGPLVVFSTDLTRSLVLSPFSEFMAASQVYHKTSGLSYGVMGNVSSLPKNFTMQFVMVLGSGVNSAMQRWGDVVLAKYGKERYAYKRDLAMKTLGYSTDNGAFYYYNPVPGTNYEETLKQVKKYSQTVGIPYNYVLLDSWWYYQGTETGVTRWEPMVDVFPNGLEGLHKETQWPLMLHNRFWSAENVYAKQNGGQYNFVFDRHEDNEHGAVVPNDQAFWDDLLANKTRQGAFMYEQDWLDNEFDWVYSLHSTATLARTWMLQMSAGAVKANQTMQLCMSHVRHVLQSVEMAAATNVRASRDYQPGNDNWNTGTTAILCHAVGLAPSKDNYWSTADQSEFPSRYPDGTREPHSRLNSVASTLSGGPVAPSDKINASDVGLIMHCCDSTGRLLSADKPAMEIDAHFLYLATGTSGVDGNLWTTQSTVSGTRFLYSLAVSIRSSYNLSLVELGFPAASRVFAIEHNSSTSIRLVTSDFPLEIKECDKLDFQYFIAVEAPAAGNYVLLGEEDKWISVSPQRFSGLTGSRVNITGGPEERVRVRWASSDGTVLSTVCRLSTDGKGYSGVEGGKVYCG